MCGLWRSSTRGTIKRQLQNYGVASRTYTICSLSCICVLSIVCSLWLSLFAFVVTVCVEWHKWHTVQLRLWGNAYVNSTENNNTNYSHYFEIPRLQAGLIIRDPSTHILASSLLSHILPNTWPVIIKLLFSYQFLPHFFNCASLVPVCCYCLCFHSMSLVAL